MTHDNFWKSFWILSSATTLFCIVASASIFFTHVGRIDTAAVGVTYTHDKDPFQRDLRQSSFSISNGYLFKDALPLGLSSWSWGSGINWRSGEQAFEGSSAIKANFTEEWAGFGLNGFSIDSGVHKTLSVAVRPDAHVGDLFIEAYDKRGKAMGRQSLGWYTPGGELAANKWQTISVPVINLLNSAGPATISAISISTTNAGTAFVDSIQFNNTQSAHERWVYKAPEGPDAHVYVPPPFNPFATSTALKLPYKLEFSPYFNDNWYSPRGFFAQAYDAFRIGPQKGENDAFAYLRGGRAWSDYVVSSKVVWGSASVFALIVRMQDEGNFASCSYSSSGDTIQMYVMVGGISTMVEQSDKLHYGDYSGGAVETGAMVHGKTLSCSLDGQQIISKDISEMPVQGTVGMEAWDQNDTRSAHQLDSFRVVPLVGE